MTDPLGQSQVLPYLVGLSKHGYEFTLLSFEKRERFEKSNAIIRSICDSNNIRWEHEFFSRRPPLLSKIYDSWKMKQKVKQLHRIHQFDFTHCRSYVAAAAGLYLKRNEGVPFLFDMRGFWVDERVDNGQWNLRNPLYKRAYTAYKKKEKEYFLQASHIISLTEKGKEELVKNYSITATAISVIPCCVDLQHFDYSKINEVNQVVLKQRLGISDENKILSYLGSLGGWYLTDEMLDFFKALKESEPAAKFLFITHDNREQIVNLASAKGIDSGSIIVEPASRQQVPGLIALSNWSIFFIKNAYSKKASSPTKQGEIMAMGIPIVCNDIGDTGRIIRESGAGFVIPGFTMYAYREISKRINQLSDLDKNKIRNSAFDYFDLEKGIITYKEVYNKLIH